MLGKSLFCLLPFFIYFFFFLQFLHKVKKPVLKVTHTLLFATLGFISFHVISFDTNLPNSFLTALPVLLPSRVAGTETGSA